MVDNDVLLRRIINLNNHFTTIMEQMVCLQLVSVAFLSPLCIHEKQKYNGRNVLTSILTFYKVWDFKVSTKDIKNICTFTLVKLFFITWFLNFLYLHSCDLRIPISVGIYIYIFKTMVTINVIQQCDSITFYFWDKI